MSVAASVIVAAIKNEFSIECARNNAELAEAQALRYEVFCLDRGILPTVSGQASEGDEYDKWSRHVLVRRRRNGELVGTVRLVTAECGLEGIFPMQRVAGTHILRDLPRRSTGEISRFALSRRRREMAVTADSFIRLGLMQGVMRVSSELGLTHWCAAMELSLLRLLRGVSIHFQPIGPQIEYFGLRQPSVGVIGDILARGRQERPELWDFVTESGRNVSSGPVGRIAA